MFGSWSSPTVLGGLLGFVIFVVAYVLLTWPASADGEGGGKTEGGEKKAEENEEEDPITQRDFTPAQLHAFDGSVDDKTRLVKPVYVAVAGDVFDVSSNRAMYGPGGAYALFAGRDASRCLAKMSFDESDLDGPIDDLNHGDRDTLDDWYGKFRHVKCYPVVGKLSKPDFRRVQNLAELSESSSSSSSSSSSMTTRCHPPLLVALRGKVYDTAYGGVDHYGPGGPYHKFVGKDVARALAKMSFDPLDIDSLELDDLTEKQLAVLADWERLFASKYPHVADVVVVGPGTSSSSSSE